MILKNWVELDEAENEFFIRNWSTHKINSISNGCMITNHLGIRLCYKRWYFKERRTIESWNIISTTWWNMLDRINSLWNLKIFRLLFLTVFSSVLLLLENPTYTFEARLSKSFYCELTPLCTQGVGGHNKKLLMIIWTHERSQIVSEKNCSSIPAIFLYTAMMNQSPQVGTLIEIDRAC